MSQVKGTISVDVAFTDSTTVGGANSLKTITLRDAQEYTSGKVAIVTGTVASTPQFLWSTNPAVAPIQYRDSAGNLLTFTSAASITRLAFSASRGGLLVSPAQALAVRVRQNEVTLLSLDPGATGLLFSTAIPGETASYTLVLYGE